MALSNHRRRRILVITHTNFACFREVVQGISSYGNTEGRWLLEVCQPNRDPIGMIKSSKPDGLLLGAADDLLTGRVAAGLVPNTVAVCRGYTDPDLALPQVDTDEYAVGKSGAEHLLAKGFCHFGFIGQLGTPWSRVRQKGFEQTITAAGYTSASIEMDWGLTPREPERGQIENWLVQQPKPLAVMGCNDGAAGVICQFCLDLELRVPDDVAILGVDNDELATAMANPPLSSVIIPFRAMGRRASMLLDQLIDGENIERAVHLLAPTGIAERQSTGGIAIADDQVRTAVRFIREHAGSPISVNDVVEQTGITRRALERKFKTIVGRTPLEELRRCRVDLARRLLSQSELTIKQIAQRSGFSSATWFTTAFHEITGESPAKFRQMVQRQ